MPIRYSIERPHGLIRRKYTGEIHFEDFVSHWRELLSDKDLPTEGPLVLFADMRQAQIALDGTSVQTLIDTHIKPLLKGRKFISAVLVGSAAAFGTTRQFSIYSSDCGETAVFYDEEDAMAWIAERSGVRV